MSNKEVLIKVEENGKVNLEVVNGEGSSCTLTSKEILDKLKGQMIKEEFLPEYYIEEKNIKENNYEYN